MAQIVQFVSGNEAAQRDLGAPKPRLTRQQAINEMCRGCIWDNAEPGTWREQVSACTITTCPLWAYRPRSKRCR